MMNPADHKRFVLPATLGLALVWGLYGTGSLAQAQQLDLEFLHRKPAPEQPKPSDLVTPLREMTQSEPQTSPIQLPSGGTPLKAGISKTLYLPPAMYGQWSVTGTVRETNISNLDPVAVDIWVLQREGDAVTVTNPVNGATATVNVEAVEGNTATFHRGGQSDRLTKTETVTLTVNGNYLYGKNLRREEISKNGKVVKIRYALFDLQGTRISGASAVFKPEILHGGPDIEIEPVRKGF